MTVDVKLDLLDIDQCPSEFYASNAFMGTANCDYETTYVSSSYAIAVRRSLCKLGLLLITALLCVALCVYFYGNLSIYSEKALESFCGSAQDPKGRCSQ